MSAIIAWMLWAAAETAAGPVAKLPVPIGKEMTEALVSLNQMLGLESWPVPEDPCLDRGGLEATAKDVSREDTQKCAEKALYSGFEELGRSYVIGITMGQIGPITAFAIGRGEAAGWGAYSCDMNKKCKPTKLDSPSKPTKRLVERFRKACANKTTIWLPDNSVCADSSH